MGFSGELVVKNLPANAGDIRDAGLIPGWGRSPGEGNGKPLQYSCLGNPMDRGAWWATVHGVTGVRHDSVTEQQQQQPTGKSLRVTPLSYFSRSHPHSFSID